MPIPLDKIQVVEDEMEKLQRDNRRHHHHPQMSITPPTQDFSFLNKPTQSKRTVHYDIEPIDNQEEQPLRSIPNPEQPSIDNILRRRYIAHWGLPGMLKKVISRMINFFLKILLIK